MLSANPIPWFKSWPMLEIIIKVEILFLVAIFTFLYSPNFLFFLKPLPVLHSASIPTKQVGSPLDQDSLINLTNNLRVEHGLSPLQTNPLLTEAANKRAKDMIINNYFAHSAPDGTYFTAWILEMGYKYEFAGENLAKDFTSNEAVMRAWEQSPSHYNNLVNDNYNEIGLAVIQNPFDDSYVIVQLLGRSK